MPEHCTANFPEEMRDVELIVYLILLIFLQEKNVRKVKQQADACLEIV